MMTAAVGIVTGSLLSFSRTEAKLNQSDLLFNEARLAVEATLQHGMAQLRRRLDRVRNLTPDEMKPSRDSSLQLEPGFLSVAASTRMQVPKSYSRPSNLKKFLAAPTVMGGLVVNGGQAKTLLIDPNTPLPQDGYPGVPTSTSVREVRVFAKSTVSDPGIGSKTAYAEQTFQILDRSLFQNTVFYNGLLEIFPGGSFNLAYGGGPIYATQVHIGNGVRVHSRIESAGDFFVGRYHNNNDKNDNVKLTDFRKFDGSEPPNPDSVSYLEDIFASYEGNSVQVQTGQKGFRELALQEYAGGLLTSEHGISAQSAVGLEFLRELAISDAAASGIDFSDSNGDFDQGKYDRDGGNFGHLLIEPSRGIADLSAAANEAERKRLEALNAVEENKWANRSSIAIELDTASDSIRMFHQPIVNGEPDFDSSGQRKRTEIDVATTFPDKDDRFWEVERFSQPNGKGKDVESGLYDFRQAEGKDNRESGRINLVRVDMEKMRKWVEEGNSNSGNSGNAPGNSGNAPGNSGNAGGSGPVFQEEWWNGGVYFKLPEQPDPGRNDNVVPASDRWALQLHEGEKLPNRAVVDPDAPRGLTLATNGAIYVQGTYNAPDGEKWDKKDYGVKKGAEVPAALIGDAIMLLSDAWDNKRSGKRKLNDRKAVDTTYSAALVTGNVPSSQGNYSGGLENYPRFLEKWGNGVTATYRGSLIRLFRSESFNARWGYGNVYKRPERNWSFHTGYKKYSPPLDTGPRSFRRVYYKELTKAEFEAGAAQLF